MKKMKTSKRVLTVLLTLMLAVSALPLAGVTAFAESDVNFNVVFKYKIQEDYTAKITDYTGSAETLDIPSTLDSYKVTSIGYEAFYNCNSLKSVTIPDSVTSIGGRAFSGCENLKSVTIPDSVTSIGFCAFSGCSLTSVTIPKSVTFIDTPGYSGGYAFDGCKKLTEINVDANNNYYSSQDGVLFNKNKTDLIDCPEGKTGAYKIPDGVTSIGRYAFEDCDGLTSITIPNSVTSISDRAFEDCDSLTSVTIPDSVTSIGWYAFEYCESLKSVTIPDSVTSIGDYAFHTCDSLTEIKADANNKNYSSQDGVLFDKNKTELIQYPIGNTRTSYDIPNSVTSIDSYAFEYCESLKSVTIPDSVTSIGYCAFYDCDSLTSVTIPESVTDIGSNAFYDCDSLTSIKIPDSVISIGESAFDFCENLTSVTIGNGVTSIGKYAFSSTGLTSITIPESVISIGDGAFSNTGYYNNPLNWENGVLYIDNCLIEVSDEIPENYAINEGTRVIADNAFERCNSTSITIPESVIIIGVEAFYTCGNLTSVTIGNGVTSIGAYAFEYCDSLTSVTIGNGVTNIGRSAFADCDSLTSVTIPDSVIIIDLEAFHACENLTSVTIGNGVTSIGAWAFEDCESLTSITIGNSVTSIGIEAFLSTGYYNDPSNWENGVLYIDNCLIEVKSDEIPENYAINEGTKFIANDAFADCDSLTSVTIPESVTRIGDYAFYGCNSLTSIKIPDSVISIGESAFDFCENLTSVTIGNGVTSIGKYAFSSTGLTSITIPESVISIGDDAFAYCNSLTIYGYSGSCAENYAEEHGYNFVAIRDFEDVDSGVSMVVTEAKALPENAELAVSVVDTADERITYDISLQAGGKAIRPNGSVTVKIPVPETMDGANVKVYRQEADGTLTDMHAIFQDGYAVFTTDHFSIYVLTSDDLDTPDVLLGDINGDKTVDAIDARWVLQASTNSRELTAEQQAAADVNADGVIDAIDARWILQASTGSRTL